MSFKEEIKKSMEFLAKDEKTIFLGYNVKHGGRAMGSLVNVDESKLIETPINENLMLSMAIGLSLHGYKPVVYYERFDFIMNAMDALVNHLDKIIDISHGEFLPKVIIRVVVGSKRNPMFTGDTHTQDFTEIMRRILKNVKIVKILLDNEIEEVYKMAYESKKSYMIIEERDLY